jgi:hypothetical protein
MGRLLIRISTASLLLLLIPVMGVNRFDHNVEPDEATRLLPADPYDSIRTDLSDYIWPTDAGRVMTSSFAEYRRAHFHGGIDISTGNRIGYLVFAARDGYVYRISVNPHGYGKMLYLRHKDGYYTTYAHLDRFSAELDARVAAEQRRLERYPVSIICDPDEFPVKQGDIIAYTGDTGIGTPHLHFEIRDPNFNFVNPLLCEQINAKDNILPTIRKIAVTPLDENSLVNGGWTPRTYTVKQVRRGVFRVDEKIHITGSIGFAVEARDISIGSNYRHGLYRHELYLDGQLLYEVRLDRAPSADATQVGLYYDWKLQEQGRGRFEKLYMDSPNRLPFYLPRTPDAGVVKTPSFKEGPHTLRIVSTDFNENSSEVTATVIINHPPDFSIVENDGRFLLSGEHFGSVSKIQVHTRTFERPDWKVTTLKVKGPDDGGAIPLKPPTGRYDIVKILAENRWGTTSRPQIHILNKPDGPAALAQLNQEFERDFVRIIARTQGVFTERPSVIVYEGDHRRTLQLVAFDVNHYTGSFVPRGDHAGTRRLVMQAEVNGLPTTAHTEFDLFPILPAHRGTYVIDDGNLTVGYTEHSVFTPVFLRVERYEDMGGREYTLAPELTVLDRGIFVSARIDSSRPAQALMFRGRGNSTVLDSNKGRKTNFLSGRISSTLGTLSIVTDTAPPYISGLSVTNTQGGKPRITFRYGDDVTGVDYHELKMYIDDVLVIPEIDGEHRRVTHHVTEPLERGSHRLTIHIKDRMGNKREVEHEFSVR